MAKRNVKPTYCWDKKNHPHKGWESIGITDFGQRTRHCNMCNNLIRYIHHIYHEEQEIKVEVGCKCCGKLTEDYDGARKRQKYCIKRDKNLKKWKNNSWDTMEITTIPEIVRIHSITISRWSLKIFLCYKGLYTARITSPDKKRHTKIDECHTDLNDIKAHVLSEFFELKEQKPVGRYTFPNPT